MPGKPSDGRGELTVGLITFGISLAFLVPAYIFLRQGGTWQILGVIFAAWGLLGIVQGVSRIYRALVRQGRRH